jgi:hypothetical protein
MSKTAFRKIKSRSTKVAKGDEVSEWVSSGED